VGVFICRCGGQLAPALDVDALAKEVRGWPEVAVVQPLAHSCSPPGLAAIAAAIAGAGLDRVVVAGCTPRLLGAHLRAACEGAGLDANLFDLVDIREGCAWVHSGEPAEAMAKAADLVRMGVARVVHREAREPVTAEVLPEALVIGGGLAGLTAALVLARAGVQVRLVEREAALGGMGRGLQAVRRKAEEAACHRSIEVLLESRVREVSGTVGRYTVTVDRAHDGRQGDVTFEAGAIIVATGATCLRPWGVFGYDGRRVVNQAEFERELRAGGAGPPASVVMILCAGQRDERIPYCSGVCCSAALDQALAVKAGNPLANASILFRDLHLPGEEGREKLAGARDAGIQLVRYAPGSPPVVAGGLIEVHDDLSGATQRLPYDRLVVASALVPQPDAGVVARLLRLKRDENGFFPQVRDRIRPENRVERGIYVCGAAHGPCTPAEAEFQAARAAYNALRHLRGGAVRSDSPVATVDETLCTGCGSCVQSCPVGAISLRQGEGVLSLSRVDPLLCKGCGNCVVACPARAIDLPRDGDAELLAQIEAALAARPAGGDVRIVAFGCEWSGYAAAELAGARKLPYPAQVRLIRVPCAARLDPLHLLWALHCGADGVFVGGCPPGECHYGGANRHAQERIGTLQRLLAMAGADRRRVGLQWITPDDPGDFVARITAFTDLVRALGPSPLRSDVGPAHDLEAVRRQRLLVRRQRLLDRSTVARG
jgi:heterodisulfide reductase subunit A